MIGNAAAPVGSFLQYAWSNARRLATVTNNAGETIAYGYNANGDVTSATVKASGGAIVKQQSALFDELGRLMRAIGASAQQWNYDYDRTDNLTQVSDPRSNLYSYAYDALSRLIRETDQENGQVNLTLDGQDHVTAYQDPRSIVTSYVRNGFGEVIQEASPDFGTTVLVRDARGLVTQSTDGRGEEYPALWECLFIPGSPVIMGCQLTIGQLAFHRTYLLSHGAHLCSTRLPDGARLPSPGRRLLSMAPPKGQPEDIVIVPNLVRGLVPSGPDQIWVADITYVHLARAFAYFAVILDAPLCSRQPSRKTNPSKPHHDQPL